MKYLQKTKFDLERALDAFYAEGNQGGFEVDQVSLESVFDDYKSGEYIMADGINRFCDDLGITPMDPVILVISKYFNAETMGIYKKQEFIEGMQRLNVGSVQDLRAKLPVLRAEFADRKRFKETYRFTYNFAREPGRRNLSHEASVELWKLLLSDKYPQTSILLEFMSLRERQHDISADSWNMVLDFFEFLQESGLSAYSDDGAWPTLIDELAEFMKARS